MVEAKKQQVEIKLLIDDITFGANLEFPYMDDGLLAETTNSSGELTVYVYSGQWWRAIVTFAIIYGPIIIHTGWKITTKEIYCAGSADWLRYVGSLLVNWLDVKQYGRLCLLEWKLYKSPTNNARLVSEWNQRRYNVAFLKFTEGMFEACPQGILQLCLLVPDLYGDLIWRDYIRIFSVSVSLCTAGAALVNWEKSKRIRIYIDLPTSEMIVLYMWAVPVTVCRLLSVALLFTVSPYWGLAGVILHLTLYAVYLCKSSKGLYALSNVIVICLTTVLFFISPFANHVIHFLGNIAAMIVWAFGTPLLCAHPDLYTAIICFNAAMFALGLLGFELHWKYWPDSYP